MRNPNRRREQTLVARIRFSAFTLILFVGASAVVANDPAIEFIIAKHQQARERLARVTYVAEYEQSTNGIKVPDAGAEGEELSWKRTGEMHVARDGDYLRVLRQGKKYISKTDSSTDDTSRHVIGKEHVAIWLGAGSALQYDHASPKEPASKAERLMKSVPMADLGDYGFSGGSATFVELLEKKNNRLAVRDIAAAKNEPLITVDLFRETKDSPPVHVAEYTVDSTRNYFVTAVKVFDAKGTVVRTIEAKAAQVGSGADATWCPSEVRDSKNVLGGTAGIAIRFKEIDLAPSFEERAFTIEGLGLPAETRVLRFLTDGTSKQYDNPRAAADAGL